MPFGRPSVGFFFPWRPPSPLPLPWASRGSSTFFCPLLLLLLRHLLSGVPPPSSSKKSVLSPLPLLHPRAVCLLLPHIGFGGLLYFDAGVVVFRCLKKPRLFCYVLLLVPPRLCVGPYFVRQRPPLSLRVLLACSPPLPFRRLGRRKGGREASRSSLGGARGHECKNQNDKLP
jgi:hypothetical protein